MDELKNNLVDEELTVTDLSGGESVEQNLMMGATIVDEENGSGGRLVIGDREIKVRYLRSFTAKLCQSNDLVKERYSTLKNELLSYKKAKPRISWHFETYRLGSPVIAKFAIKGKTLSLYLALNPEEFADSKYIFKDVSNVKKYSVVPMCLKIKSNRSVRWARELIAIMAEKGGWKRMDIDEVDYYPEYRTTQELVEAKEIKLLGASSPDFTKFQEKDADKEPVEEIAITTSLDETNENVNEVETVAVETEQVQEVVEEMEEKVDVTTENPVEEVVEPCDACDKSGKTPLAVILEVSLDENGEVIVTEAEPTESATEQVEEIEQVEEPVDEVEEVAEETVEETGDEVAEEVVEEPTESETIEEVEDTESAEEIAEVEAAEEPTEEVSEVAVEETVENEETQEVEEQSTEEVETVEEVAEEIAEEVTEEATEEVAEEEGDEVVEETVEEAVEEPADNETVVTEEVLESEEEEEVEEEPQVVLPERDFEIVKEVFVHRADKDMSDEKATSLVEVSTSVKSKSDKNGGKAIVNIDTLSANYKAGETVTLESLKQKHLVSKKTGYLKILGRGVLNKPLVVEADDFTVNALKMILLTGGRVIKID